MSQEIKDLERKIDEINKQIATLAKTSRNIKKEIRKLHEEKEKLEKKIQSIKRKIARERNDHKRRLLKERNFKCDSCGEEVKKIDYISTENNLVLCNNCWKKPEYIQFFKKEISSFDLLPRYFDFNFEEMRNIEKAVKLNLFENLDWEKPVETKYIDKIFKAAEEGKNYLYTKELVEFLSEIGIKKSWISEMEKSGIIKPAGRIEIEVKRGKKVEAKLWDKRTISLEKIKKWKEEKEKTVALNKVLAKEKISSRLKEIHQEVKKTKKETEEHLQLLKTYHPFLEIAFYLYHANHYAKTEKYKQYQSTLYNLKEKVLLKAYKLYPDIFEIYFIERGDKVKLCRHCKETAYDEWRYSEFTDLYSFGDYIKYFITPCSSCIVTPDYYSLVEFSINTPVAKYNFHIPYPNVKNIFKKKNLPKIKLDEEEVYVNFGRGLEKYEALIVPLKTVIDKLNEFLKK